MSDLDRARMVIKWNLNAKEFLANALKTKRISSDRFKHLTGICNDRIIEELPILLHERNMR